MSTTLWRYRRALAYAWLLRSQPGPLQDAAAADRLLARRRSVIEDDLWRMGLQVTMELLCEEQSDEQEHEDRAEILAGV